MADAEGGVVLLERRTERQTQWNVPFLWTLALLLVVAIVAVWYLETGGGGRSTAKATTFDPSNQGGPVACAAPTQVDATTVVPPKPATAHATLVCLDDARNVATLYYSGQGTTYFTGQQLLKAGLQRGKVAQFRYVNPSDRTILQVDIWNCASPDFTTPPTWTFFTLDTALQTVPWATFVGCALRLSQLSANDLSLVCLGSSVATGVALQLPVGSYSSDDLSRLYQQRWTASAFPLAPPDWTGVVASVAVPFAFSEPTLQVTVYAGAYATSAVATAGLFPAAATFPTWNPRGFFDATNNATDVSFHMDQVFPLADPGSGTAVPYAMSLVVSPFVPTLIGGS
jgi:hypothetical protein